MEAVESEMFEGAEETAPEIIEEVVAAAEEPAENAEVAEAEATETEKKEEE